MDWQTKAFMQWQAVRDTVFVGTNKGLYRLNSDVWQPVSVGLSGPVYSVTGFEDNLYIGIGSDHLSLRAISSKPQETSDIVISDINWMDLGTPWTEIHHENATPFMNTSSRILHSTDLGGSWTQITHENESPLLNTAFGLLILTNTGEMFLPQGIVTRDENAFYRAGPWGIHRSTDSGKSWHPFMNGIVGSIIQDLVATDNRLYAYTGRNLVQSTNGGDTWETLRIDSSNRTPKSTEKDFSLINSYLVSRLAIANNVLYGIAHAENDLRVFNLFPGDAPMLVPVQGVPAFKREFAFTELQTWTETPQTERLPHNREKSDNVSTPMHFKFTEMHIAAGGLAVNEHTLYVEAGRRLFRWRPGDVEWIDTGLIDAGSGFKLAVSGETVYVGKRDGKLLQSLDAGNSWKDVTFNLPLHFERFNEIIFVGSTVYVATDTGVLVSQTGEHLVGADRWNGKAACHRQIRCG